MQRSLKDLESYRVSATDGDIGSVVDFLLDDQSWVIRYLVVKTGGALGGRRVLVSPMAFQQADAETRRVHVALTMAKVKNSPDIDMDKPVSRQHERDYNLYYRYPHYWGLGGFWGMSMYPGLLAEAGWVDRPAEPADQSTDDVHLRSAHTIRGYHVQGSDEAIGHVADFLVDDETWGIRYLVIDTGHWWSGKRVLVAPHWADRISWEERKLFIDISRDAIKNSPEWIPTAPIERLYEQRLHDYYGQPPYWGSDGRPLEPLPSRREVADHTDGAIAANPRRTTSFGWLTTPKFGSATSGGGEIEPGPERD